MAEQTLKRADSRELILARDLATFEECRTELAQRVMEAAHQAFRQKSARQEAELRGVTRELGQELREFGERLAGRRGDLTAPQREVHLRRSQIGQPKRRVSGLGETIGWFFDAPADRAHEPEDRDSSMGLPAGTATRTSSRWRSGHARGPLTRLR